MLLDLRGDLLVPGGQYTRDKPFTAVCTDRGHVHDPHHKQDLRSEIVFTRIHHDRREYWTSQICPAFRIIHKLIKLNLKFVRLVTKVHKSFSPFSFQQEQEEGSQPGPVQQYPRLAQARPRPESSRPNQAGSQLGQWEREQHAAAASKHVSALWKPEAAPPPGERGRRSSQPILFTIVPFVAVCKNPVAQERQHFEECPHL